ncbi:MAG: hypothetical protein WBE68_01075 [Candidatus Nitrosopolaris sp.]
MKLQTYYFVHTISTNVFVDSISYYESAITPELAIAAAAGGAELII